MDKVGFNYTADHEEKRVISGRALQEITRRGFPIEMTVEHQDDHEKNADFDGRINQPGFSRAGFYCIRHPWIVVGSGGELGRVEAA